MQLYRRCNCPVLIVPLKQQLVQQISKVSCAGGVGASMRSCGLYTAHAA
jgi:hypothetical protein